MEMEPIGISSAKPPRLTDGNFNRWKTRFECFVRSQNYQCWLVIKNGDLEVPAAKKDKEADWGPEEFKLMEANAKAICFLQTSLCERDATRVSNLPTAKLQWEALEKYHVGTPEMKEDVQLEAKRDFYKFRMFTNETITDYSFRFEALLTKLKNLGVKETEITQRMKVQVLIDGLTGPWNFDRMTFKENQANKGLSMEEIYGKLKGYEARRNQDLAEMGKSPQNELALTLAARTPEYEQYYQRQREINSMLEAKTQEHQENLRLQASMERKGKTEEQISEEDELALLHKSLRAWYKRGKVPRMKMPYKKESRKPSEAEMKEIVCYKCNRKGHMAKKCTTGLSSKEMKEKALVGAFDSAWDDLDSSDEEPENQVAYMAMEDAPEDVSETEQEVTHESMLNSLEKCSKPKLIKLITQIMQESYAMKQSFEEIESENIIVECESCSTTSLQLESSQEEVKSLKSQIVCLTLENASLRDEVKVLGKSPMTETVNPIVFVPARKGLGYESGSKNSLPGDFEASKTTELELEREKTRNLEERIRVLESGEKGQKDYYTNSVSHKIYKNIAKGKGSKVVDPEKMKENRIQRPNKRYYLGNYYRTCWHCGKGGHYQYECLKLKQDLENGKKARNGRENAKPKTRSPRTHARRSNDVNVYDHLPMKKFYPCNEPGRGHLAWVAKN